MASGDKSSSPGRQILRERLEVGETGAPAGHSAVVRGSKPDIDFDKVGASSRTSCAHTTTACSFLFNFRALQFSTD